MVVVPLVQPEMEAVPQPLKRYEENPNWVGLVGGGALVASGILLLTGRPRAALVSALAGTTLVALDQAETVKEWWEAVPKGIDHAQRILAKADATLNEISTQRERIHRILVK